jgi:hypothetical protein
VQSTHDSALAFDGLALAFELAGMGVAPSLVAQQLAFFGVSLFELDAFCLGSFDQFDASGLEQLAVGGVGDGFFLDGGVDNDAAELFAGNQLQGNRHFNGAGQEFFHAFFAQQFAELDQLGWVARPAVLKVLVSRKVLPSGCLAPALDEVFVAFVEGMFEVRQRDHQASGQARASGFGDASTGDHFGRAKQVRAFNLLASAHLACKEVSQRSFYFLPRHAVGQNGQWMTQIDRLIEAVTKEIGGDGHMGLKNSQKTSSIEYQCGSFEHWK